VASYHRAQIFYPTTNGLMTWWQILISASQTQLGNCSGLPGHAGGDEQTSPGKHQGKKGRGVSRRGGSFTKEEDTIICSAFVNVSKDLIVGVNQSSGGYYKHMHDYYQAHKPAGSNRS
jgi:hypothetical protein